MLGAGVRSGPAISPGGRRCFSRRTSTILTHPTIDQLRTLKLDGLADAFIELQAHDKTRDLAHAELLALPLDRER
jgi:hypothetical protein